LAGPGAHGREKSRAAPSEILDTLFVSGHVVKLLTQFQMIAMINYRGQQRKYVLRETLRAAVGARRAAIRTEAHQLIEMLI
jgi:hypothetical protein